MEASNLALTRLHEQNVYACAASPHVRVEAWFNATVDRVYDALFDARCFTEVTGVRARNNPAPGGRFSYFAGMIEGTNLELTPPTLAVQSWRLRHWCPGCFSVVAFRLHAESGGTRLLLQQWGFPEGQRLEPLWDRMFWIPVQRYLAQRHDVRPHIAQTAPTQRDTVRTM